LFSRLAHFAALLSREMDEPALRFIGSMAMVVFGPPDDGELQEKFCVNFVQNWHIYKPVNIIILSGVPF
jgi:hypothetical protein